MIPIYQTNSDCPICSRHDWCMIADDGTACICNRIEKGSVKQVGQGWLHILSDQFKPKKTRIEAPKANFTEIFKAYRKNVGNITESPIEGVRLDVLRDVYEMGYDGENYIFPMKDHTGTIIGLQRRKPDGSKLSVKASKVGLFIPKRVLDGPILITEGLSDAAYCFQLGFTTIGRQNCSAKGINYLKNILTSCDKSVIIVADNDDVGREGARKVAEGLCMVSDCKIIVPPDKDVRESRMSITELNNLIERARYD